MDISSMTMDEFKAALAITKTVVLPFGTVEAHGTGLPLSTDTIAPVTVAEMAAQKMPILVAPPLHYGVCRSSFQHPGTMTISFETLRSIAGELIESFYAQGIRNILLLTGHGGSTQTPALILAGDEALKRHPDLKIAVAELSRVDRKGVLALLETPNDNHAGEYETSLILAAAPNLVKAQPEASTHTRPDNVLVSDNLRYWPSAIDGDPSKATIEKGIRLLSVLANGVCRLIRDLENS